MNNYLNQPNQNNIGQIKNNLEQPAQVADDGIGVSFGSLMGEGVSLPVASPSGVITETPKKKKRKPTEKKVEKVNHSEVVDAVIYKDTYEDTNEMLRQTIGQLDVVASECKAEMDNILQSRTMKSKYMALGAITKPLTDTLSTKVQAIKELNNSIKAVNDLEYRRAKDNRAFESQSSDDKAIMDMYNAFIQAPMTGGQKRFDMLGASPADVMFNMVEARENPGVPIQASNGSIVYAANSTGDVGYDNYLSNATPEQRAMMMEDDPDVETVVVYDKKTGAKQFQVMNLRTGAPVPNMPLPDPMFLTDTYVDVRQGVARNTNLNQVYKLICINGEGIDEY